MAELEALKMQAEVGAEMVREALQLLTPSLEDWQMAQVVRIVVPFQTQKAAHLAALERIPELLQQLAEEHGAHLATLEQLRQEGLRVERLEAAVRRVDELWRTTPAAAPAGFAEAIVSLRAALADAPEGSDG